LPVMLQPLPGPGNRRLPRRRFKVQASAPRLRPSKGAKEESTESWMQKRRGSIEEQLQHHDALWTAARKAAWRNSQIAGHTAEEDSSSGEEEYVGSLSVLDQAKRQSKIMGVTRSEPLPKKSVVRQVEQLGRGGTPEIVSLPNEIPLPEDGMLPLEDLFPIESGKPCFEDGECQLCGRKIFCEDDGKSVRDAKILSFGNPHCRGCSVVDALSFQQHPFSRLLLGADPGVKMAKLKAKPYAGKRMHPTFPLPPEPGATFCTNALQTIHRNLARGF